ncbi:hypothetical protein DRJ16_02170 [Candidatus Woesearchaeota archaeon]|nr:MAG: hypothetical protein DRJ16_02170 [Candidatus Woesearchaeota archaeon]
MKKSEKEARKEQLLEEERLRILNVCAIHRHHINALNNALEKAKKQRKVNIKHHAEKTYLVITEFLKDLFNLPKGADLFDLIPHLKQLKPKERTNNLIALLLKIYQSRYSKTKKYDISIEELNTICSITKRILHEFEERFSRKKIRKGLSEFIKRILRLKKYRKPKPIIEELEQTIEKAFVFLARKKIARAETLYNKILVEYEKLTPRERRKLFPKIDKLFSEIQALRKKRREKGIFQLIAESFERKYEEKKVLHEIFDILKAAKISAKNLQVQRAKRLLRKAKIKYAKAKTHLRAKLDKYFSTVQAMIAKAESILKEKEHAKKIFEIKSLISEARYAYKSNLLEKAKQFCSKALKQLNQLEETRQVFKLKEEVTDILIDIEREILRKKKKEAQILEAAQQKIATELINEIEEHLKQKDLPTAKKIMKKLENFLKKARKKVKLEILPKTVELEHRIHDTEKIIKEEQKKQEEIEKLERQQFLFESFLEAFKSAIAKKDVPEAKAVLKKIINLKNRAVAEIATKIEKEIKSLNEQLEKLIDELKAEKIKEEENKIKLALEEIDKLIDKKELNELRRAKKKLTLLTKKIKRNKQLKEKFNPRIQKSFQTIAKLEKTLVEKIRKQKEKEKTKKAREREKERLKRLKEKLQKEKKKQKKLRKKLLEERKKAEEKANHERNR